MNFSKSTRGLGKFQALFLVSLLMIGCASKSPTMQDESNLAEADLFDGLKEEAQSIEMRDAAVDVETGSEDGDDDVKITVETEDSETSDVVADMEDSTEDSTEDASEETIAENDISESDSGVYENYYTAVGGESIKRIAYALYNSYRATDKIYSMNEELRSVETVDAGTKVFFSMDALNPRSELLTKDIIDRYKDDLWAKLKWRREQNSRNSRMATVVVRSGDTLQKIAENVYGSSRMWVELYLSNLNKIDDYDVLTIGTKLSYFPVVDYSPPRQFAKKKKAKVWKKVAKKAKQQESDFGDFSDDAFSDNIKDTNAVEEDDFKTPPTTVAATVKQSTPPRMTPKPFVAKPTVTPTFKPVVKPVVKVVKVNKPFKFDTKPAKKPAPLSFDRPVTPVKKVTALPPVVKKAAPPVTPVTGGIRVNPTEASSPRPFRPTVKPTPPPVVRKSPSKAANPFTSKNNGFGAKKQIRPLPVVAEAGDEEGGSFLSRNLRHIIYVSLIIFVLAGRYFLTKQPNGGFKNTKFNAIQPLPSGGRPGSSFGGGTRPRMAARSRGTPPTQKTG